MTAKLRPRVAPQLVRRRLDARLARIWEHRLGLVVAPAGYGKTSLVAAFAAGLDAPVAWYRADTWDTDADDFLSHLEVAVRGAAGGAPVARWRSIEEAMAGLEAMVGSGRMLLVVDDLHTVEGTATERLLERVVEYAPPGLAVLIASRSTPTMNLSRLRVDGALLELGADELRFRSWEVEELFRDLYDQRVSPEEVAELARRTDGWAAGLQLFHLATRERPEGERRRVLSGLATHSRLVREYLTRNVLEHLPRELRDFLVATSVLGRLSGPLCDRFLERTGSAALLAELERRRLFVDAVDGDTSCALHEVLRSHLEEVLLAELGEDGARAAFRRSAEVLIAADALPEALRALCRAEDWESAVRLLGGRGSQLVAMPGRWVEALPEALIDNDPWLLLARARRHRDEGRWEEALDTFRRVEQRFTDSRPAGESRTDRLTLAAFTSPSTAVARADHWLGRLRSAVIKGAQERSAPSAPGPAAERLVLAVEALLLGRFRSAREEARAIAQTGGAGPGISTAALLVSGACALLTGDGHGAWELAVATDCAERQSLGWLGRMARAARALEGGEFVGDAASVSAECRRQGDRWGEALAGLCAGWGALRIGEPAEADLRVAGEALAALGASAVAAWARCLGALAAARSARPDAMAQARVAERLARQAAVPRAAAYAFLALALIEPDRSAHHRAVAAGLVGDEAWPPEMVAEVSATAEPQMPRTATVAPAAPVARAAHGEVSPGAAAVESLMVIRCFGGLRVTAFDTELDLSAVKPRVRSLLRLLAASGGEPAHWEVIATALWPEADLATASRNVRVAISSLRQLLEPATPRGRWSLLVRSGDAYRLAIPEVAACDVHRFHLLLAEARSAHREGLVDQAVSAFAVALEIGTATLLPEEGPSEWLAEPRRLVRTRTTEVAELLADALLARGNPAGAARVCAAGLGVEPAHDPLWRQLIEARRRTGDHAAAEQARREYERLLVELGVGSAAVV